MQSRAMVKGTRLVTAEEFARTPGYDRRYELVDGVVVEMTPVGGRHGWLALRLARLLADYVDAHQLGVVMVETGFTLARNPDTVRGPDVSFVGADRIPAAGIPETFWSGPPDLAVEIRSPSDTVAALHAKGGEYLARGVRLVWILDPAAETVTVSAPHLPLMTVGDPDVLEGGDVVPGLRISLRELFARPDTRAR